jgi:biopolymer transport protein ExbD
MIRNLRAKRPGIEKLPSLFCMDLFSLTMAFLLVMVFMVFIHNRNATPEFVMRSIPIVDNPKVINQCNYKIENCGGDQPCIYVSVDKNQQLFIQERAVSARRFYAELRKEVKAQRSKEPIARFICLNADKRVPMATIFALINIFKSFEIELVILVTSPGSSPELLARPSIQMLRLKKPMFLSMRSGNMRAMASLDLD